jgi:hypothetical protein
VDARSATLTLLNSRKPPCSTRTALGIPLKLSSGRVSSELILPTDGISDVGQSSTQVPSRREGAHPAQQDTTTCCAPIHHLEGWCLLCRSGALVLMHAHAGYQHAVGMPSTEAATSMQAYSTGQGASSCQAACCSQPVLVSEHAVAFASAAQLCGIPEVIV